MQAVQNERFINPNRAVRIFGELDSPAKKILRPRGVGATRRGCSPARPGGVTIALPHYTALEARRIYGRFVWPKESPSHVEPGAPECGTGRLYQFVAEGSFISKRY